MKEQNRCHFALPIPEEDWKEFKALCKANGTNITTALTAAFYEVKEYLEKRDVSVFKDFKIKD